MDYRVEVYCEKCGTKYPRERTRVDSRGYLRCVECGYPVRREARSKVGRSE